MRLVDWIVAQLVTKTFVQGESYAGRYVPYIGAQMLDAKDTTYYNLKGIASSSVALGILLNQGIGNTIRVSLTPQPNEPRTQEVIVAQEILQALGMRNFVPSVTACPGCGRTTSTYFQTLASNIDTYLRQNMPIWKQTYKGVENLK